MNTTTATQGEDTMKTQELRSEVAHWLKELKLNDKAENTIKQYSRSLNKFIEYAEASGTSEIDKELLIDYKNSMIDEMNYNLDHELPGRRQLKSPNTINLRLIALNRFFKDAGAPELNIKTINVDNDDTLDDMIDEEDYRNILKACDELGNERIKLIIKTLAGTGIRISELQFITVESLENRIITIKNKGKIRKGYIPKVLAEELKSYCQKNQITNGTIFHGRKDKIVKINNKEVKVKKMLDQAQIRRDMKEVARKAGIKNLEVIHPHIWRHFYARRYVNMPNANSFYLPKLLGHSTKSQGVTAIYLNPTKKELLTIVDEMERYYLDKENQ